MSGDQLDRKGSKVTTRSVQSAISCKFSLFNAGLYSVCTVGFVCWVVMGFLPCWFKWRIKGATRWKNWRPSSCQCGTMWSTVSNSLEASTHSPVTQCLVLCVHFVPHVCMRHCCAILTSRYWKWISGLPKLDFVQLKCREINSNIPWGHKKTTKKQAQQFNETRTYCCRVSPLNSSLSHCYCLALL